MAEERCDLCGAGALEAVYTPAGSTRGLTVHCCAACGLLQSLPRTDTVAARTVAVSAGADWGNIRYGKGFRAEPALMLLRRAVDLAAVRRCLDVGANRGAFLAALRAAAPHAAVVAIEPDAPLTAAYTGIAGVEVVTDRLERVTLPPGSFDVIHCSHTLEHLASPHAALAQMAAALADGGVLFVEVPDLAFIGRDDVVEEWFIDKHLYHFSRTTLARYLADAGLAAVAEPDQRNNEYITVALSRSAPPAGEAPAAGPVEASRAVELVDRYRRTGAANRAALTAAAARIERLAASRRVVVWGAGRIFDTLVRAGGLHAGALAGVVDRHLSAYAASVHGCPLRRPDELPDLAPDVVIIASRAFAGEIRSELARLAPGCAALDFGDLLRLGTGDAAP